MQEANRGIIEAAIEISERRRELLSRLKDALERGDETVALALAKQLCGMEGNDEQKSDRVNPRIN
jgi:uncharacterized protein YpiB (UPF0302 family)